MMRRKLHLPFRWKYRPIKRRWLRHEDMFSISSPLSDSDIERIGRFYSDSIAQSRECCTRTAEVVTSNPIRAAKRCRSLAPDFTLPTERA